MCRNKQSHQDSIHLLLLRLCCPHTVGSFWIQFLDGIMFYLPTNLTQSTLLEEITEGIKQTQWKHSTEKQRLGTVGIPKKDEKWRTLTHKSLYLYKARLPSCKGCNACTISYCPCQDTWSHVISPGKAFYLLATSSDALWLTASPR